MNKPVVAGISLVAVIGVAYLGGTAYIGRQAEAFVQQESGKLQTRYPWLVASAPIYQRGFLKSTSTMSFQLTCAPPGANGVPLELSVKSVIRNGPLAGGRLAAATIDSEVNLSGEVGQKLRAAFGSAAPLSVHTVVGFDRSQRSDILIPAAKGTWAERGELVSQGLTGTIESHGEPRTVTYRLKSPGFMVSSDVPGVMLKLGAMEFKSDGKATSANGMMMVGTSQASLASLELAIKSDADSKPAGALFTGIALTNDSSLDGELMNGNGSFKAAGMVNGAKIDQIDAEVSFKRLHAPTYEHMMQTMSSTPGRCDTAGDPAALSGMLAKMRTDLMAMLKYNPEFSLDKLTVDHDGQRAEMAYFVGVQGMSVGGADVPIEALLGHLQAKASVRVPVAWIDALAREGSARSRLSPGPANVDLMIDQGVGQGFLVRDGGFVASKLEFGNGQLLVNGQPIPIGGAAAKRPGR